MIERCWRNASLTPIGCCRRLRSTIWERKKVLATPGLVKLAARMPPNIPVLRLVEIVGVDIQADGGPHVRNTRDRE